MESGGKRSIQLSYGRTFEVRLLLYPNPGAEAAPLFSHASGGTDRSGSQQERT